MGFGQRVKRARSLHDLTQQQLAELTGVTRDNINRWENTGQRDTHASWLLRVAEALDVCPFWLLFGEPYSMTTCKEEGKPSAPPRKSRVYGRHGKRKINPPII